ncbi:MAG: hypothetical protein ACXVA9_06700 [Bdellovibrionales bacterium]
MIKAKLWPRSKIMFGLCAGFTAFTMIGCSKGASSSDASSSSLTVSGSLTQLSAAGVSDKVSAFQQNFSTADTSISLDCGASGTFTGTVDATTGAFSASGVPAGVPCSFNFVSSSAGTIKCQVQFQDASSYDLNNNPMSTSTATATTNVVLGSITCDTSGNITVDSATIPAVKSGATIDATKAFDFTGEWTAAVYDGVLPTGVQTLDPNCGSNCHGPSVGQAISLVRFHGQQFTPTGSNCTPATNVTCPVTDGTVDATKDGFGMSIWGGDFAHGIGACGSNTGFTADEARAFAHLSLDATAPSLGSHALSYAHYSFTPGAGFGTDSGWTKAWMYGGATSSWDMMDCQPVSVPSTPAATTKGGYACFSRTVTNGTPTAVYVWNAGLQNSGGCVDASNHPVMVSNWANITGSCTSTASTFNTNLTTNTCTYTGAPNLGAASTSFTCSFTGGTFRDVSGGTLVTSNNGPDFSNPYTMPANTWSGQPATIIASGAACAGGLGHDEATLLTAAGGAPSAAQAKAAKELLMRYQCYANQYWQHSGNGSASTACTRSYNFNWATNNYANFMIGDDRSMKPENAFITDRVFYSPDGQWAFLKNTETKYQTVPTASGSALCPMKSMTELKFKRVTDSKLIVDFSQVTAMADNSASCQGAVIAALAGGGVLSPDPQNLNSLYKDLQMQKFTFYLTK